MRETNVSHETVALGTASIVMLDGIKDAVAVSKGSNRVEHRTLGEIIVATDGSDVTLEVLFRRAINGTLSPSRYWNIASQLAAPTVYLPPTKKE